MRQLLAVIILVLLDAVSLAASKPHVISFGKTAWAKWWIGADEITPVEIKVRGLYIDGKLKEFTVGAPHDVTDHFFVVRRVFHLNDALPDEVNSPARWRWQRGGWLLVDRLSGHVSQISLPEFDAYYSSSSWYRDYVAYCGMSDDGKKLFAVVAQIGQRKPILKKSLSEASAGNDAVDAKKDMPDSECPAPIWQRQPARVTFIPSQGQKFTYSIRGHDAGLVSVEEEDEGSE